VVVSPFIDIDFENEHDQQQVMENMNNMSISGAQEKFSAISSGIIFDNSNMFIPELI
jgi:hypothetical protein